MRRVVQHIGQVVAEMLDDPARERGSNAFYFRGEIALDRRDSRRPYRFEIEHAELIAVARMLLGAASRADARADLDGSQVADDGDAAPDAV